MIDEARENTSVNQGLGYSELCRSGHISSQTSVARRDRLIQGVFLARKMRLVLFSFGHQSGSFPASGAIGIVLFLLILRL